MAQIDMQRNTESKLCSLPLSRPPLFLLPPLTCLGTLNTLPADVISVVSKNSDLICPEGKIQSELVDLQHRSSTILSGAKFHESNFIMIRDDYAPAPFVPTPFVLIFGSDGKEIRRFEITQGKREFCRIQQFALIGHHIYLVMSEREPDDSDGLDELHKSSVFQSIVVYDLNNGKLTQKWPTKFSEIFGLISCSEHILLTTSRELFIQVFNRNGEFSHKFGDYKLWGETNQHLRCSLCEWTSGRVIVSYRGEHRMYNTSGQLLQVLTFEDFGFGSNEHAIVTTCVTESDEILFFLRIPQTPTQLQVFVFKHVSTKVELQRTFAIEVTAGAESIHSVFSFPNGSIFILFKNSKIYIYK